MRPVYSNADPATLKNHTMNIEIYGDKPNDEVMKSIKENGIYAPIVITNDNVIVSGHTRNQSAKILGLKEVPVLVRGDLTDELDIRAAIIEANKQREKTTEIKAREFQFLKEIEAERAKKRQKSSKGRGKKGLANAPDLLGNARDIAAKEVGMGSRTAEAAAEVVEKIDELEAEGETEQAEDLRHTLNQSVSAAKRKATGEESKPGNFDDSKLDKLIGQIARLIDQRFESKGGKTLHADCIKSLRAFNADLKAWRAK